MEQLTWYDIAEMCRDNQRVRQNQAYEQAHPGYTRLSPTGKLRVMIQDALLEGVPDAPQTLTEVVRLQEMRK
jgi:hypothetical protein